MTVDLRKACEQMMDLTLPTFVHVSGGRTSAYLAKAIYDSGIDCEFLFQNTGAERLETYEFLKNLNANFGVPITWLEYYSEGGRPVAKVVNYETANRNRKPFEQLLAKRKYIPNLRERFCTVEMKVLTGRRYIRSKGIKKWNSLIGFRHDEPSRILTMNKRSPGKTIQEFKYAPLDERFVTIEDVQAFWGRQSFDLELPMMPNGKTIGGNCKGCFFHSEWQNARLCRTHPEDVEWLITQEKTYGGTFQKDVSWEERREETLRFPEKTFDMEEFYCTSTHGSCGS